MKPKYVRVTVVYGDGNALSPFVPASEAEGTFKHIFRAARREGRLIVSAWTELFPVSPVREVVA